MKWIWLVTSCALLCGVVAFGQTPTPMAEAELQNAQGQSVGLVTFTAGSNGVMVVAHVHHLAPGYHGFHIHETGKCTPPDFKSAGDHFNPFGAKHGLMAPHGRHAGDMPNLLVGPDGTGTLLTYAPLVTLGAGTNALFHAEGTALVIHQGTDDLKSDPAGDAGSRVACGQIHPVGQAK